MRDLSGRTAFITGAAQGIGLGIARACAARGMKLAIVDTNEALLREAEVELSKTTTVAASVLDVRDREAYAAVADQAEADLGPVTLLCNNAGVSGQVNINHLSYEAWDWVMGINLNGVYNGLQTFLPRMLSRGGNAHIVNTASGAGLIPNPGFLYAASKAGVVGLSESLRMDLAPHKIGVSVLCPSAVATKIIDNTLSSAPRRSDNHPVTEELDEFFDIFRPLLAAGSDPDAVGEMVIAGVEARALYILTDDLLEQYVTKRAQDIVATMPKATSGS